MRSMSMYDLPIYLIFLALLEALCWWLGAWFFAALFLALYAVFAVASLRNDLILRYDRVIVVLPAGMGGRRARRARIPPRV